MPAQYHISLPDPSKARGNDPDLSFHSQGAAGFAEELQDALRSGTLFERWKAKQPDPDAVLAAVRPPGRDVVGTARRTSESRRCIPARDGAQSPRVRGRCRAATPPSGRCPQRGRVKTRPLEDGV
ncbi:MAG: hypothetical protein J0H73_09445 [Salana multivorans]|nr:hypothetical protein [Salana multivorans]